MFCCHMSCEFILSLVMGIWVIVFVSGQTWKSLVFHETNFTFEIIMFNHQMLPPFEICWQI